MPKIILIFFLIANMLPENSLITRLENEAKNRFIKTEKITEQKIEPINLTPTPVSNENNMTFSGGLASISIDLPSNKIISEQNADTKLQIASLTKLMTAYVALKELPLDKVITVPKLNLRTGDAVAGLAEGEKLTVLAALEGLLINSGSDAAQTLAVAVSGSQEAFVIKMNEKAKELKLENTHYANPVGWDDQNNYSTAKDIASLTKILLRNKTFSEITSKRTQNITTQGGRTIQLSNTNILLSDPSFVGIKTGYTPGAGECLVTLNKRDEREILTVILGSADRFGQTRAFIDWIFTYFSW